MDQAARLRGLSTRTVKERARVIAVASGKGGVGKTNIVVNLGLIMARQGKRALIFDADMGMANADILLGIVPRYSLVDVIRGQRNLQDIIIKGPHNLLLIPGISGVQELAELDPASRALLIEDLTALADEVDVILIDSGAGISRSVLSFAMAAGESIVIASPEPTSIADAYCLIKGLNRLKVSIYLIVNRSQNVAEGVDTAQRLQGVCNKFLQMDLPLLGIIPEDPHVGQAVRKQQPYSSLYPHCRASIALEEIVARLQGRETSVREVQGFWQKLGQLLGR